MKDELTWEMTKCDDGSELHIAFCGEREYSILVCFDPWEEVEVYSLICWFDHEHWVDECVFAELGEAKDTAEQWNATDVVWDSLDERWVLEPEAHKRSPTPNPGPRKARKQIGGGPKDVAVAKANPS